MQAFNFTKGRRKLTDVYRGGSGTITGRRPDLLPAMNIGDTIEIQFTKTGQLPVVFYFRLSNFRIIYGFTSSADTWEIEIEDAFAYLGRGTVTYNAGFGSDIADLVAAACTQNGLTLNELATETGKMSAQNIVDQNALDVVQTAINTTQARVYAESNFIDWYPRNQWQDALTTFSFSDDGTGTYVFNEIDFGTLADNYADQIIIFPRGGTEAVVGDGVFSYNLDSFSLNQQEAIYLGEWLLGSLVVKTPVVRTLSYSMKAQTAVGVFEPLQDNIQIAVKFRGNNFDGIVEGYQVFADPSDVRIQLFLSDASYYDFFVLNNALFGRLNANKLGW